MRTRELRSRATLGTLSSALLAMLMACSSTTSSPSSGKTEPGSELPVVEVPKLETLPELVPAFHESVATLDQAQATLGQAHQDLSKADPTADQALFLQKADAYIAASKAWVNAGQVANGYGSQFPGFVKENGSNPVMSPEQLAAINAGHIRLAETLGKLKAQLDAGTISKATYDNGVWASGWKEFLARGVALPFNIAGKGAEAIGGAVAAVKGYTLATSLSAAGAGGVATQVTAGAVATAGVKVLAAAGVTYGVCWLCGKAGAAIGGTKANDAVGWCVSTGVEFGPGSVFPAPVGSKCTIDIPGKPPIFIDESPGPAGWVFEVDVKPGNVETGELNGPPVLTPIDTGLLNSCDSVFAISATTEPPDPGPGQSVTVIAVTIPPVAGCEMKFAVTGTDKPKPFHKAETTTTDAAGKATFFIPGGAKDVVDTVTVSVGGHDTTLTYSF